MMNAKPSSYLSLICEKGNLYVNNKMILTLFVRAGVGRVSGQLCMIVANDATVKAGLSCLFSKLNIKNV
jgi:acetyl-CoA carboxylase carboxyltransferase component